MPPKYIRPKQITYHCENCGTNIVDNWWWCPQCETNVSLLEIPSYTRYQRFLIFLQRVFCCNKPIELSDLKPTLHREPSVQREPSINEVDTIIRDTTYHGYRESYV